MWRARWTRHTGLTEAIFSSAVNSDCQNHTGIYTNTNNRLTSSVLTGVVNHQPHRHSAPPTPNRPGFQHKLPTCPKYMITAKLLFFNVVSFQYRNSLTNIRPQFTPDASAFQFRSVLVCVFTLDANAARLRSATPLAIWSPTCRTSIFAGCKKTAQNRSRRAGGRTQKQKNSIRFKEKNSF